MALFRTAAMAAVLSLCTLTAPAAHAATWGEPTHVRDAVATADHEFLTDPAGNAILAYVSHGPDFALMTRVRPRGGSAGEPQRMAPASSPWFDMDVDLDGTTVLAWIERGEGGVTRVRAATRVPGAQRFGEPQDVAVGTFEASEVLVATGGGDAVVGWRETRTEDNRTTSTLQVSIRESRQPGFGARQTVMANATSHAIDLARDGSGFAVGGIADGFQVARRDADGGFVTQENRTLPNEDGNTGPQLAVSPSGRAVVATSSAPSGEGSPEGRHAVAAIGDTSTGFEPLDIVSGPGCRFAHVAISPDDRAVVAWNAGNGSRSRVQALVAERGQGIDDRLVQTISARNVRGEAIAAGRGRVAVTWQRKQGDGRNIEVASAARGQGFGDYRRVQRIGLGSFPEAAASQAGTAWIAWTRFDRVAAINAAQVYASSGRVGRVTRVATDAYFGGPRSGPLAPSLGGRMVMEYNDAAAEPEHLDLIGYAGG